MEETITTKKRKLVRQETKVKTLWHNKAWVVTHDFFQTDLTDGWGIRDILTCPDGKDGMYITVWLERMVEVKPVKKTAIKTTTSSVENRT